MNKESILNPDIGDTATKTGAMVEDEPQRDELDHGQAAISALNRGPNTLEDINELRNAVYANPESWDKFDRFVREQLTEADSDYEEKHAIGLALLGHYDRAEEELERLNQTPIVGCLLARIYLETDREVKAVALLRKIHDRVPEVPDYHILLCRALEAEGEVDAFLRELEIIEQKYPNNPETLYLKGRSMEREGEYEAAKRLYQEVLDKVPNHGPSLFRLALRSDLDNDDDEAVDYYNRAISTGVPNVAAVMNLGVLYEDREQYDEAVQCFETVVTYYPNDSRARKYLEDARASLRMYYDEEKERKEDKQSQILKIPVSDFELSVRSRNCLAKMNIQSLGDLIKRTEAELLAFKNFGETSLMEIKEILSSKGLRLGMITAEGEELPALPDPAETNAVNDLILNKPISDLDLSVRSRSCLGALSIQTLGHLAATSEQILMSQKNFGQTSLNEIRKKLADYGLSLKV